MANTLKFGNGEWYGKKDTILAYNDENSNYKPLPFDFSRASSATVVNKDGLIETVGSGQPRIDYKDDSKGALLLEPSRTNSITYSEDFSDASWIKSNLTVNSVSENNPLGNKCYKIIGDNNNNLKLLYKNNILTSDTTFSVLVKASGYNFALIKGGGGAYRVIFDLVNGTVGNKDTDDGIYSIEDYGNGWYRCSAKFNNMPTNYASVTASATNSIFDKTGNGVDGILLAYTQAEIGSYATSYIPTQGSAVTRLADSCSQTVPDGIIGQTEGTLFLDFKVLTEDTVNCNIFNTNKNTTNAIAVIRTRSSKKIQVQTFFNSVNANYLAISTCDIGDRIKLAFKYKNGDIKLYINGILENSATPTFTISSPLSEINLADNVTYFARKEGIDITSLQLYNTALTDQELAALTS